MGEHLIGGEFQSDKYPWCRPGFVPLKVTDPMAQPVLATYADVRREIDEGFSDDLKEALRLKGYDPDGITALTVSSFEPDFRDPETAFENAIKQGFLSRQDLAPNTTGLFMYMYSKGLHDYFKHIETRRYLAIPFERELQ